MSLTWVTMVARVYMSNHAPGLMRRNISMSTRVYGDVQVLPHAATSSKRDFYVFSSPEKQVFGGLEVNEPESDTRKVLQLLSTTGSDEEVPRLVPPSLSMVSVILPT